MGCLRLYSLAVEDWSLTDSHGCQQDLNLSLCDHKWKTCKEKVHNKENLLGPTEITENGSQCCSITITELHLQPCQRLENIWANPCTWCITTICKFWGP
jgi:hypothetical protein